MKNFKPTFAVSISLFFLTLHFPNFSTANETSLADQIKSLSLEEKVGQLFIVGFPQTALDQKLKTHIEKNKLGAFLLFKRNIQSPNQVAQLNSALYKLSKETTGIMPVLAVDQEGGFVNRIPISPSTPHAISVGISKSTPISFSLGDEIGRILSSLGFNMNLAPVLDLAQYQKKSFIGVRSFGSDPTLVGSIGAAYSLGLMKHFVVPTAKHFPGLGDSVQDPHNVSVVRNDSVKQLLDYDLSPFRMYSALQGQKAIMLSHMIYPQLDEENQPASFSEKIIKHWLRKELAFDGVVMTDDLHMKASTDQNTVSEGAVKALRAGVDMVMLSWSFSEQEKTFRHVLAAYKNSQLSLADLDEKVLRILKMKSFMSQKSFSPAENPQPIILSEAMDEIDSKLFLSKLNSIKKSLALDAKKSLCMYSTQNRILNDFKKTIKLSNRSFLMHANLAAPALEGSIKNNSCQISFMTVYNRNQAQLAVSLSEAARASLVVLNMGSTAFLRDPTQFLARIDVLSLRQKSGEELARFLNELNTSLPESPSQLGLAQSRDAETQSSRRPSSLKPTTSRPQ